MNSATRIEGEAAMSALLVFQSAGREDLHFWGGGGRTNGSSMGEPIIWSKGKLARRGKHDARLGRVVQVRGMRKSSDLSPAEMKSHFDETKSKEVKRKDLEQKECISRSERTLQVMVEARQYQNVT